MLGSVSRAPLRFMNYPGGALERLSQMVRTQPPIVELGRAAPFRRATPFDLHNRQGSDH